MKRFLATLLILCGLADSSSAAAIHVRPKLAAVLRPDFYPADSSVIKSIQPLESVRLRPNAEKYVLQFDYLMTIEYLVDDQLGFGNVVFNIDLLGIEQSTDYPGWVADTWIVDRPGPVIGFTYKWAGNLDAGQSAADLKHILVESVPKGFFAFDPRRRLGMPPFWASQDPLGHEVHHTEGEYIGSTFLEIPGTPGIEGLVTATVLEGSTFNAELLLSAVSTTGGPPANFRIEVVPEPGAACLAFAGAFGLVLLRRIWPHNRGSNV